MLPCLHPGPIAFHFKVNNVVSAISPGHFAGAQKRKTRSKRYQPVLEALECRYTPAVGTAFNGGVLSVSMNPGDDVHISVENDGGIDVSHRINSGGGVPTTIADLVDQRGVTSIVVTQAGGKVATGVVPGLTFEGANLFPQLVTTTDVATVNVAQAIIGAVSGNAVIVNVSSSGTIQNGVDLAQVGGTLHVAAGTYVAPVVVNKTLTLDGANAGVDARGRPTHAESNVEVAGVAFTLAADNIVLDGFTIGNGTNLPGNSTGVVTSPSFAGYRIRNNVIENEGAGLSLGSDITFSQQVSGAEQTIVEMNLLTGNGTGVTVNQKLGYMLLDNNTFAGTQIAINLNGGTGVTITNNSFQNGNNVQLENVSVSTVSNNQFAGSSPGPAGSTPTALILAGGDSNIGISGNTFIDRGWQDIQVANGGLGFGPNASISIEANTINQDVGLLAGGPVAAMIDLNGTEGTARRGSQYRFLFGTIQRCVCGNLAPPRLRLADRRINDDDRQCDKQ